MAEIGLIASVLQVAGAGLKLSQTLYQYADSVASADRRVKDIATEVELTSRIISELGTLFELEETSRLLSQNALETANKTVRECSSVFTEIDSALMKTKKNTLGRLMLPFRESKIELLRRHIDTLKSTLQLLLQVLVHAQQVATQKQNREAEVEQRKQIRALLKNKEESARKYAESLRRYSMSQDSTVISDDDESGWNDQKPQDQNDMLLTMSSVGSTLTASALEQCVHYIRGLLSNISALQKALAAEEESTNYSQQHQTVIHSYFQARGHLDSVLLGNPQKPVANQSDAQSNSPKSELESAEKRRRIAELEAWERYEMEEAKKRETERGTQRKTAYDVAENKAPVMKEAEEFEHWRKESEESEKADFERRVQEEVQKRTGGKGSSAENERPLPITFKDAVGRKFRFPYDVCKTWEGMERLIKQAFECADDMTQYINEGRYELKNGDGETILAQLWDVTVQPGWSITMQMHEIPQREELAQPPPRPHALPPGVRIVEIRPERANVTVGVGKSRGDGQGVLGSLPEESKGSNDIGVKSPYDDDPWDFSTGRKPKSGKKSMRELVLESKPLALLGSEQHQLNETALPAQPDMSPNGNTDVEFAASVAASLPWSSDRTNLDQVPLTSSRVPEGTKGERPDEYQWGIVSAKLKSKTKKKMRKGRAAHDPMFHSEPLAPISSLESEAVSKQKPEKADKAETQEDSEACSPASGEGRQQRSSGDAEGMFDEVDELLRNWTTLRL